MDFEKGKYVIALAVPETKPYHGRYLQPGVYKLRYRLCCDDFLTCGHAGSSITVWAGNRNTFGHLSYTFHVGNIHPVAFDDFETAEVVKRLVG